MTIPGRERNRNVYRTLTAILGLASTAEGLVAAAVVLDLNFSYSALTFSVLY